MTIVRSGDIEHPCPPVSVLGSSMTPGIRNRSIIVIVTGKKCTVSGKIIVVIQ